MNEGSVSEERYVWSDIILSALAGAVLGVLFTSGSFTALIFLEQGGGAMNRMGEFMGTSMIFLVLIVIFAGPGAFVLGIPFALILRRLRSGIPSGLPYAMLAVFLGIPFGLANLFLSLAVFGMEFELFERMWPNSLAGGAGLGLGIAWVLWRRARKRALRAGYEKA